MEKGSNIGSMIVHLNNALAIQQFAAVSGEEMKPGPEGNNAIGACNDIIGSGRAEGAEKTDIVWMARKSTHAFQRCGQRSIQSL